MKTNNFESTVLLEEEPEKIDALSKIKEEDFFYTTEETRLNNKFRYDPLDRILNDYDDDHRIGLLSDELMDFLTMLNECHIID